MIIKYVKYLLLLFILSAPISALGSDYYVDPSGSGDSCTAGSPCTISTAIGKASAGDTIRLLPGTYSDASAETENTLGVITLNKSGTAENPITFISDSSDPDNYAVIDGGGSAGDLYYQGIQINSESWLVFENLKFQNCWKYVIRFTNSNYLTIRNCSCVGGTVFVQGTGGDTHHILVEYCDWEYTHLFWTTWGWQASHDSDSKNGSFFDSRAGWDARGASVIRYNSISDVFNGIQMYAEAQNRMANIEIYENTFEYILDNAIEPEVYTFNLHIYHNTFDQVASGILSLTGAVNAGGPIYFYGNVGYYDPSDPYTGSDYITQPRSYRAFKHEQGTDYTEDDVWIVHNSWVYRKWNTSTDRNEYIIHKNNIGVFTLGYLMKDWQFAAWNNVFDYDLTDTDWPASIDSGNQESHGIENDDPEFIDFANNDWRLEDTSPCKGTGTAITGFSYSDAENVDMGAYDGDNLVEGPPFYIQVPSGGLGYTEKPRITRHRVNGTELRIFWSWELDSETISTSTISLRADNVPVTINTVEMGATDREVIVTCASSLTNKDITIAFDSLPTGTNAADGTMWASTIGPISGEADSDIDIHGIQGTFTFQ